MSSINSQEKVDQAIAHQQEKLKIIVSKIVESAKKLQDAAELGELPEMNEFEFLLGFAQLGRERMRQVNQIIDIEESLSEVQNNEES